MAGDLDQERRTGPRFESIGETGMQRPSPSGQEPRVGGIVDERVGEPPRVLVGRHDERRVRERLERPGTERGIQQLLHDRTLERDPDDGCHPDRLAGFRLERIDPGSQHGTQRDRQVRDDRLGQGDPTVPPLEGAVLEEGPDGLPDEQRVAARALVDASRVVGIQRGPCDERHKTRRLGFAQARQFEPRDIRLLDPTREHARTGTDEHDERPPAAVATRSATIPTLD